MKICITCKTPKDESEFNFKNKLTGLKQAHCRACQSVYHKKHYDNKKAEYIAKSKQRAIAIRKENQQKLWDYLRLHPCVDCLEADPVVLEFDHLHSKLMAVTQMLDKGYSWQNIEQEIAKCEVRCANCHRRKTAKQFNWYKDII